VFIFVDVLHYFGALIILFVYFKCHQVQDDGGVLIVNAIKVVSELGWGVRDG